MNDTREFEFHSLFGVVNLLREMSDAAQRNDKERYQMLAWVMESNIELFSKFQYYELLNLNISGIIDSFNIIIEEEE